MPGHGSPRIPYPVPEAQFRDALAQETLATLAQRYGVSVVTVWRWRQRLGVKPLVCQALRSVLTTEWQRGTALARQCGMTQQGAAQMLHRLAHDGVVEGQGRLSYRTGWRLKEQGE